MSRTAVASLPMRSESTRSVIHALLDAIHETRARRARQEIARHAELIDSARRHRLALDARHREHGQF
jgi:hypothetical protein